MLKVHKKERLFCAFCGIAKKSKILSHLMLTFSLLSFRIKCEKS
nr:MAG TPA: hypothetical protein [Caudoviricetes sp.]